VGLNLDLHFMLGIPTEIRCPRCGAESDQGFDDYDVECGHPNVSPGEWLLSAYCATCEHEWKTHFVVVARNLDTRDRDR